MTSNNSSQTSDLILHLGPVLIKSDYFSDHMGSSRCIERGDEKAYSCGYMDDCIEHFLPSFIIRGLLYRILYIKEDRNKIEDHGCNGYAKCYQEEY